MANRKSGSSVLDVNLAEIVHLNHNCDGCSSGVRCCCSSYEVCVTRAEMRRIVGVMPEASEYCPILNDGDSFENVFGELEDGLYPIETDENGLCVFAYFAHGMVFCALHSVAEALGYPWFFFKPLVCALWPLSIPDGRTPSLSVDSEAYKYHCNSRPNAEDIRIMSLLDPLAVLLGAQALNAMQQAAGRGLQRIRIAAGNLSR